MVQGVGDDLEAGDAGEEGADGGVGCCRAGGGGEEVAVGFGEHAVEGAVELYACR